MSIANWMTFGEYTQLAGSSSGNVPMRDLFACAEIIPSGTRTATQSAPLPPGPEPIISMIHASSVSAIDSDSPVDR